MKKLVALAVAGAFMVPAYAADVSVSGEVEFLYQSTTSTTGTAGSSTFTTAESAVKVTATETINDIRFTASVVMDQDAASSTTTGVLGGDNGGTLTVAFPNGFVLGLGSQNGAMDSVDDISDVSPALGGYGGGGDHSIKLTLPKIAGVEVILSHSPKDGTAARSTTAGLEGFALRYSFPNGSVYYAGEEDIGATPTSLSSYGIKYGFSGITVAYEAGNLTAPGARDVGNRGVALTYKMGDVVLGVENQYIKTEGQAAASTDMTTMFAEYNLGSSVDVYLANQTSAVTNTADIFAVGVEFAF